MAAARYRVGDFDLAVISDGTFRLDAGAVFGLIPRVMWEPIVGKDALDDEYRIPLGLNCLLVRRGSHVVLIETGMGNKLTGVLRDRVFPGDYGHLLDELGRLGVRPQDVTHVVNTHLHTDHCGWNTVRGDDGTLRPTFPLARYYIERGEFEAASHPNDRTRATYLNENFAPLTGTGQLELINGEHGIVPGITFLPTPGHTADHASVVISSGTETAIYLGDMAQHQVQVERPPWISSFDVLPLVSLETKQRVQEQALRTNALLVCVHNPFPGVGRLVERDGRRTLVAEGAH